MTRLGAVQVGNRGIVLSNMDDIFRFAKAIHMSQLCPAGFSETDCFVIIANGLEVGMSPMAAIQSTYVVNNRATIFGDMPLALVRASSVYENYSQKFVGEPYADNYTCVVTSKRKGEVELVTEYSVFDAKEAELWEKTITKNGREFKTPWCTAKKRMLLFRSRGFNLRDNFGDVLKGCAIAELDDRFGEPGFAEAKQAEGRVVEPNFAKAQPPAELPQGNGPGIELKPAPAKTEVAEPLKRGPGRPRKVEGFTPEQIAEAKRTGEIAQDFMPAAAVPTSSPAAPPTAAIPAAEGVDVGSQRYQGPKSGRSASPGAPAAPPETKPAAPEQKPPGANEEPPRKAPPPTPDSRYWELHKRLADEKISHDRFLLVMHDFGFLDGVEREDISNGSIALSKLEEKGIRAALSDWATVTENLPAI